MNIIYTEPFKKSFLTTIQQIAKNAGTCEHECNFIKCSFYETKIGFNVCTLFTEEVRDKNALSICNIIYGLNYTGEP